MQVAKRQLKGVTARGRWPRRAAKQPLLAQSLLTMFLLGVGNTLLTSSSTLMPQPQCSVTPEPPLTEEEQRERQARPVQRVSESRPGSAQQMPAGIATALQLALRPMPCPCVCVWESVCA